MLKKRIWVISLTLVIIGACLAFGKENKSMKMFHLNETVVLSKNESVNFKDGDLTITNIGVQKRIDTGGQEQYVVILSLSSVRKQDQIQLLAKEKLTRSDEPMAVGPWGEYVIILVSANVIKELIELKVSFAITPEILKQGWYYGQKRDKRFGTPDNWIHVLEGTRGAKWIAHDRPR